MKDLSIPYFCGQNSQCQVLGDKWAMEMAMENVKKFYSVVGVIEDFPKTLRVLESTIPEFFEGVMDLYFNILQGKNVNQYINSFTTIF